MKLAFADCALRLSGSDFVDVPRGLPESGYAKAVAARIKFDRTSIVAGHKTPPDSAPRCFEKRPIRLPVADPDGNRVACTQPINAAFGFKANAP